MNISIKMNHFGGVIVQMQIMKKEKKIPMSKRLYVQLKLCLTIFVHFQPLIIENYLQFWGFKLKTKGFIKQVNKFQDFRSLQIDQNQPKLVLISHTNAFNSS